jgi:hypothetical protein
MQGDEKYKIKRSKRRSKAFSCLLFFLIILFCLVSLFLLLLLYGFCCCMISVREWNGVYRREGDSNSSSFFSTRCHTHTLTLTYKFNELNEGKNACFNSGVT